MSEQLFKRLESFRKRHGLSILALCRQMEVHNVTYHRWKKAKKITGAYKKIVKEFLDKNENIKGTEIIKDSQSTLPQSCPKTTSDIAIIGLSCFYPGAHNIRELWENILARRIQFRRMLDKRLPLNDYYDQDPKTPDKTYLTKAAFIDGFEFNWSKLRIPKVTFQSADIVHWLALDTALKAFEDTGYNLDKIPLQNTGVILGNTLTGEQTRSQTLRLRWPYVQRTLNATLESFGIPDEDKKRLSEVMEKVYKSAFYPITEDSLAGGLANTIAGRICNYLNLKGGGYLVDGACSSSLIAVATAANALKLGEMDLALAGGVDVSLDPFELVGFSKVGALAKDQMRVYDQRANGFFPGEGCGFVVLKRLEDAIKDRNYIYAVIKGWGISSDGKGGIMEPTVNGQALAIERAYKNVEYKVTDIDFIEGHGTGTTKGDRVELEGIAAAITKQAHKNLGRIYGITSFKSIVGHTKAAAGIGGFIKAVLAVNQRILPPTANCQQPNDVFEKEARELYPIIQGRIYPKDKVMRAGISSAGFGGINCHITIESKDNPNEKIKPETDERALFVSNQNTEVFVFASRTVLHLLKLIQKFKEDLRNISIAEMADLSARLNKKVKNHAPIKIAIVADSPEHLYEALCAVEKELKSDSLKEGQILEIKSNDPNTYILLGNRVKNNRIGFLYSGQGAQRLNMTRTLVERFTWARDLLNITKLPLGEYIYKPEDQSLTKEEKEQFQKQLSQTEITQPAVVFSSLVWTEFLSKLGIEPVVAGGHSLGEIMAFYRGEAFDKRILLKFAELRGRLMADKTGSGQMVSLFCDYAQAEKLVSKIKGNIVISNINSPNQTVVSGGRKEIEKVIEFAKTENISTYILPVSNAFHSSFMQTASQKIASCRLLNNTFKPGKTGIYSCINGDRIKDEINLREYFSRQVLSPVNFIKLIESMSGECDLFIEVGPGRILTDLVKAINKDKGPQCIPVEGTPQNDRDFNITLAQVFIRNVRINWEELYRNRAIKPFVPASRRKFIENQCERPLKGIEQKEKLPTFKLSEPAQIEAEQKETRLPVESVQTPGIVSAESIASVLIDLTHKLTGFDKQSLSLNQRLLDDLNLDSIKAAELIGEAGKILGLTGQLDPSQYSNYTLMQIRDRFLELKSQAPKTVSMSVFDRYQHKTWVRDFVVKFKEETIQQRDPTILKKLNKIDILCDESRQETAFRLKQILKDKRAEVQIKSYDELDKTKIETTSDSNCLICLLPADHSKELFGEHNLKQIINRLHQIMTLATSDGTGKEKTIVFVQFGGGDFGENDKLKNIESYCARSFASALHLERPDLCVRIVDFDRHISVDVISSKIIEELQIPMSFSIAGYDNNLNRKVPIFHNTQPAFYKKRNIQWSSEDIVLVTGGAKGITAECALEFAKKTKARMALVGRSKLPAEMKDHDSEIIRTLNRFKEEKLQCQYYSCDVTNLDEVEQLISKIERAYGRITAVIHGAGLNTLKRLKQSDPEDAYREALPKVMGAVNICKAFKKNPLKLIVGITSVIGVTGMEGSGWYGLSNEILNLFLHQFKAEHKGAEVVTIAYSVWDEVGMGMRLGSLDWLLHKGISLIPVEEGVKRFMHLVERDSGNQQTIIVARVGGLDTWRSPHIDQRKDLRFIEDIKYCMPGVELIAQAHLNIKDDPYVLDHNWKGTLLFPFVFGLEAMTQAAVFLTGKYDIGVLKVSDVHLDKPIIVNQDSGTRIEIHAEVLELKTRINEPLIKIEIFSEHDNFKQPAFSAIIEIREKGSVAVSKCKDSTLRRLRGKTIDLDLEQDVYGKILFQGKSFRCINRVHKLSYDEKKERGECVFTTEYNKSRPSFLKQNQKFAHQLLIGDPFFIDSVLQSMQLIIPQDICLPNHIEEIDLSAMVDLKNNKGIAKSDIKKIDKDYYTGNAKVFDRGKLLLTIKNCHLKILDTLSDNPSANDLVNPLQRDQKIVENKLNDLPKELDFTPPIVKCLHNIGLKDSNKTERHRIELPLIISAMKESLQRDNNKKKTKTFKIKWLKSGRPVVLNKEYRDIGISLSHDGDFLICVAGWGTQGCDIETIINRSEQDWHMLLGNDKFSLLNELCIKGSDINLAGTAIWSASEAIRKYYQRNPKTLEIESSYGEVFCFTCKQFNENNRVVVFPIRLTLGKTKMFSVVYLRDSKQDIKASSLLNKLGYDEKVFSIEIRDNGPQRQPVYIQRFPITFKHNQLRSKRVNFTSFFEWIGEIREYALYPIMEKITELTETGGWGLATNSVSLYLLGELRANDIVEARLWLERVLGARESTFDFVFEWRRILPDGSYERVGLSELRSTWLQITGHGEAKPGDLPSFLKEFMDSMLPKTKNKERLDLLPEPLSNISLGEEVKILDLNKKAEIFQKSFETTLEDSNLVGNIYFANYVKWLARTRDSYFYQINPYYFKKIGQEGEFISLKTKVVHLQEAMPFDRILVKMYIKKVYTSGMDLVFDFFKSDKNDFKKLAHAENRIVWVRRKDEMVVPEKFPEDLEHTIKRDLCK